MHRIVLSTFLCHHCTTTTWKCLILRFIEDVKKTKTNFFPDEFVYLSQNKRLVIIVKKFERMRIHFLLKSDVLTAVTVVVPWTWGIWRVAGKKYFRSPYQTLPYSLLKVPIVSFRGREYEPGNMSRGIWAGEYEPGNMTREIWARKIYITFFGYCY